MADVEIFHNPSCSKSRSALELLQKEGIEPEVTQYLRDAPDRATLTRIVKLLDVDPAELVRKDKRFKDLGLDAADFTTPKAVVDLLHQHPELMERPVVIRGDRAVIGRPPEKVLDLL